MIADHFDAQAVGLTPLTAERDRLSRRWLGRRALDADEEPDTGLWATRARHSFMPWVVVIVTADKCEMTEQMCGTFAARRRVAELRGSIG